MRAAPQGSHRSDAAIVRFSSPSSRPASPLSSACQSAGGGAARSGARGGADGVGGPGDCVQCPREWDNVSESGINSQDAAFEPWLSEQPWNQGSRGSGETDLREVVREAVAESRLAGQELPANGRESPGRTMTA